MRTINLFSKVILTISVIWLSPLNIAAEQYQHDMAHQKSAVATSKQTEKMPMDHSQHSSNEHAQMMQQMHDDKNIDHKTHSEHRHSDSMNHQNMHQNMQKGGQHAHH